MDTTQKVNKNTCCEIPLMYFPLCNHQKWWRALTILALQEAEVGEAASSRLAISNSNLFFLTNRLYF